MQAGIVRLKRKGRVRSCLCYVVVDRAQQLFPMMLFRPPKAGQVQGCFLGAEGDLQGSSASISS